MELLSSNGNDYCHTTNSSHTTNESVSVSCNNNDRTRDILQQQMTISYSAVPRWCHLQGFNCRS